MAQFKVNSIRIPDEFRYALASITENFSLYVDGMDEHGAFVLRGLSPQQKMAEELLMLVSEASEVLENLNMVMADMERLSENPRVFMDKDPFSRFKLLLRLYFYEYGRFEDVFGYFTQWKQKRALMSKSERKEHREAFYSTYKDAIKTRNVMMHDAVSWREQYSPEITLLQGLEAVGKSAIDRSGKELTWKDHIEPLCRETLPELLALGQSMLVFWNMELAGLAQMLVEKGQLQKASKPYIGPDAEMFLKIDKDYR